MQNNFPAVCRINHGFTFSYVPVQLALCKASHGDGEAAFDEPVNAWPVAVPERLCHAVRRAVVAANQELQSGVCQFLIQLKGLMQPAFWTRGEHDFVPLPAHVLRGQVIKAGSTPFINFRSFGSKSERALRVSWQ